GYKRREIERVAILSPVSNARSPAKAAAETGDEPGMIAALYGKTVAVARRRYEAGRALLERGSWDVFLLDDGYQHRRLERDLDLLVLGADCRGWVLPAGPFREPRSALRRAHAFLITGAEEYWARRLEAEGRGPSFRASLEAKCLIGWEAGRLKEAPLARLDRSRIVAVAGIANPDGFFNMIYDWGGDIVAALRFPDHHAFGLEDWQRIGRVSRDADLIITTEKDLLKLAGFPFAKDKLFALRVAMVVENGDRLVQTIAHTIGLRAAAGKSVEAEKG
ncbi:MAG TPA: tetraacyldisaccharide 4'-kinase, partial [Candidatus Eisenbacteria bacterium]|nr:tetraacyldisaccharide 4'-kinase [Candidatus Eisenbacteria bacterium]